MSVYSSLSNEHTQKPAKKLSEVIASLVGDMWAQSVTPMNILSGFKKSGTSLLNPSKVSDRMLAPAKVFKPSDPVYEFWLKKTHPGSSDADSMITHINQSVSTVSSGDLSDILKYPESNATTGKKKISMNTIAVCSSDSLTVHQLKEKKNNKTNS